MSVGKASIKRALGTTAAEPAKEEKKVEIVKVEAKAPAAKKAAPKATTKATTAATTTQTNAIAGVGVWVTQSGTKYHSHSGCSSMKNPSQITVDEAVKQGYTPCKKCW